MRVQLALSQLLQITGAHTEFAKDLSTIMKDAPEDANIYEAASEVLDNVLTVLRETTKHLANTEYELVPDEVAQALEDFNVDLDQEPDLDESGEPDERWNPPPIEDDDAN